MTELSIHNILVTVRSSRHISVNSGRCGSVFVRDTVIALISFVTGLSNIASSTLN